MSKDTKHIWAHLRTLTENSRVSNKCLPEELIIDNEYITGSEDIAEKMNKYFTSIADIWNQNDNVLPTLDTERIGQYVNNKIPKRYIIYYTFHNP